MMLASQHVRGWYKPAGDTDWHAKRGLLIAALPKKGDKRGEQFLITTQVSPDGETPQDHAIRCKSCRNEATKLGLDVPPMDPIDTLIDEMEQP